MGYLARKSPSEVRLAERKTVSAETLDAAGKIMEDVRIHGDPALRSYAERFGEIRPGEPMVVSRSELQRSLEEIPSHQREVLERVADRIDSFARAQMECIRPLEVAVPGGTSGHSVTPVDVAGCYAPGGRFPLPSSVLMTAVVARAAGVGTVWVASPKPVLATRAAAAIAGADALLCVGGAHAIAAMAYGVAQVPRCDVIVGPGNRYVTAAKQIVSSGVAIDMLAGPSEVVIVADHTADPEEVAADLLAQAEHDPDAMPVLISLDETLPDKVEDALERQLADLPTAVTARAALCNGFVCVVHDQQEAAGISDSLAPEHLELLLEDVDVYVPLFRRYGALFVGPLSGEVIGDYGIGPNHTLPTGGSARYKGGLSVFSFLKVSTWLRLNDPEGCAGAYRDAVELARMEGLEAHARSAERRLKLPLNKTR